MKSIILALGCLSLVAAIGCAPAASSGPAGAAAAPATPAAPAKPANPEVILATTTSTQDSGLLDVLIPTFEKATGYQVKTIAVGSGQAMAMGQRGEADVLLVHAPGAEKQFMAGDYGINRRFVMHNDFVVIGPPGDAAKIKGLKTASEALKKISTSGSLFVSRGDNSGTDQLEKKLWKDVGFEAKGKAWYQETGQGMGATLGVAAEKKGYTLTDRATYLALKSRLGLDLLVEGDAALANFYHVIPVNPAKFPKVNAQGGRAFADFMVAKDTQETIAKFGADKYGQPLFFPDAGKPDPTA